MTRMEIYFVEFKGQRYPTRILDIPDYGEQVVSVETLEDALFNENGEYVSKSARAIDDEIFFYATDEDFTERSDESLIAEIVANL